MARIRIVLAYDGTTFAGWQLQSGVSTIQGCLEEALRRIVGEPVRVHASGRTDSGVHAVGQVAHFDIPDDKRHIPWHKALNTLIPRSVSVLSFGEVPRAFHARYSVIAKSYSYTLWTEPDYLYPQRRKYVWACGRVDLAAMDTAAAQFVGEHDFRAFMNTGTDVASTVRRVLSLRREPGPFPGEVVWRVRGTGFLKQMVRNIMGCLVAVGRGRLEPDAVRSLLGGRDRRAAPPTAPSQGLCLEAVEYPEHLLRPEASAEPQAETGSGEA